MDRRRTARSDAASNSRREKIFERCEAPIRRRKMTAERSSTAVLGNGSAMAGFGRNK